MDLNKRKALSRKCWQLTAKFFQFHVQPGIYSVFSAATTQQAPISNTGQDFS